RIFASLGTRRVCRPPGSLTQAPARLPSRPFCLLQHPPVFRLPRPFLAASFPQQAFGTSLLALRRGPLALRERLFRSTPDLHLFGAFAAEFAPQVHSGQALPRLANRKRSRAFSAPCPF